MISSRLVLSFAAAGVLGVVLVVFLGLMRDARESATRAAALSTGNLAASLAHDVERNAELLDRSLQGVARTWGDPRVQTLAPDVRNMVLFDNSATATGFGPIMVLDQTGAVAASSRPLASEGITGQSQDYFLVHVSNPNIGLFVSRPFQSGPTRDWVIGFSRRISGSDGSFRGVAVGTISVSYLEGLFANVDFGGSGGAALLRLNGVILAQVPPPQVDSRRNLHADIDRFGLVRVGTAGSVSGPSLIDGIDRITSFRRIGRLPLIQLVEIRADEVYAEWRHKFLMLGLVLASLTLGTLVLIVLLNKELVRRTKAEDELSRLATTDPLTSLANRRQFDEVLEREWRTAQRERTSMALLIIDVDEFKCYNDTQGHPAGDEVLRLIAERVAAGVHRPSDLPCRIGGEEFTVLLPRTDDAGALTVGEAIRLDIERIGQAHPDSRCGRVTVSIGAASIRPKPGQASDELMSRADRALYQAKGGGRNRVCLESASALTLAA